MRVDIPNTPSDGYSTYDPTLQSIISACNYYCDSRRGSDSNDGITPATAVRTIAKLQTLIGSQNSIRIGLARGSSWRETLTIGGANVSVLGCGALSDARPILRADDPLPAATWALAAGKTVTYQATITLPGANSNKQWINVYENGSALTFVADAATVETTAGSYTVTNQTNASGAVTGTGTTTLYIHAGDGSNPTSSGKLYEYTTRSYALTSTGNNTTVVGVETRRNGHHDGSLTLYGTGNVVYDCIVRDGSKHNALIGGGSLINSQIIDQYYGTSSADMVIWYGTLSTGMSGANWTVQNSTISKASYNSGATTNAVYSHTDGTASWGTGTIKTSALTNVTNGFDGTTGGPANFVMDGNVATVGANLTKWAAPTSIVVKNNLANVTAINGTLVSVSAATSATITVDRNRINGTDPYAFVNIAPPSGTPTVTVSNNVCFISGFSRSGVNGGIIQGRGSLNLTGNAFDAEVTIFAKALDVTVTAMTAASNVYNCHGNNNNVVINGSTVTASSGSAYLTNAAAFQTGLEAGSAAGGTKGLYANQVL